MQPAVLTPVSPWGGHRQSAPFEPELHRRLGRRGHRHLAGDTQYTASSGSTTAPAFVQTAPIVTISSSTALHPTHGNASVAGAAVTYTVTFTDPSGGLVTPTGTATFTDAFPGSTNPICTVTLIQSVPGVATASCVESANMLAGDHDITVTYSGDTNYTAATNPTPVTWVQHVVANDTSIAITPPTPANGNTFPPNNVIQAVYTPVTLQAAVGSTSGTTNLTNSGDGSVTFYLNGVAINPANFPDIPAGAGTVPNCTNMPVNAAPTALVTCPAFPMPKGTDKFTAAYLDPSGQAGYASVLTTAPTTWRVVAFATNTQVTSSPATPVTGQPVTLTSTVVPISGATEFPTGTLTFTVNGEPGHLCPGRGAEQRQPARRHLHAPRRAAGRRRRGPGQLPR